MFVPFALKTFIPAFEPYPAIILPSGASLTNVEDGIIQIESLTMWAESIDSDNEWEAIDIAAFLDPVPVHYVYALATNQFGLNGNNVREIRVRLFPDFTLPSKTITKQQEKKTREWLKQKLADQNFKTQNLRITISKKAIDTSTNRILSEEEIHEQIIRLAE